MIYTRVSTDEQSKEGVSLDNQLEKCRLQAQLSEYRISEEIEDAGKSAKSLKRPGIQRLLALIGKKKVNSVIIFKLDRLTRNVSDLNSLVEKFNDAGVSLISVKDSLDTKTASGRMVINILGTISQWERETIGERTREALEYKKNTGKVWNHPPYGYDRHGKELIENPNEQETIRLIIKMRTSGSSYQTISTSLVNRSIPNKNGDLSWDKAVIRKIFLREQSLRTNMTACS